MSATPMSAVSLQTILITNQLRSRSAPAADLQAENIALHALADAMASGPEKSLQALVDSALNLCRAGSAGVSILDEQADIFRWVAMSGAYAGYVGGTTPAKFSPCGTCLERNAPQLYDRPARYFSYFQKAAPEIVEGLVIPFRSGNIIGTIWVVAHDEEKKFTSEDVRILTSLGQFTAAAVSAQQLIQTSHAKDERFRATFTRASVGMAVTDLSGRFIEANEAFCKNVGYTREELGQFKFMDITHPDDLPLNLEQLRQLSAGEISGFIVEKRYIRKDGSAIWVKNSISSIPDTNGKPIQAVVLSEDITERKTAQEAVQNLNSLIEYSPDFIGLADADLRGLFVNRAGRKMVGLDDDIPVQKTKVLDYFPIEDRPLIEKEIFPILIEKGYWSGEVRFEHFQTHERIPVMWNAFAVPDQVTGRASYACISRDLRDIKRAEAAMRGDKQFLERLIESSRDCIKILDLEGRLVWMSESGKRALEIDDICPLLNLNWQGFWKGRDEETANEAVIKARAGGVGHMQGYSPTMKGKPRWWDVIVSPILGAENQPERLLAVSRDITDQKVVEEELRKAKESAEAASAAKDEFLAVLSHELRTPLTPVMLAISLVESHANLPADLRDDVATIRRNVELESRLISDLLDLTRIAKGKLQLDLMQTDLHLVVRCAIEICQREASARLMVDLKARNHIVRGDSTRLQQIFWNLINNAHKFTGPEGTITVRSIDLQDGMIRVEISDTGVGIAPEVLPRLFNAFEQGEVRVSRKQAGLGLGLAISKKLVEAHQGQINVRSEGRGFGATFIVDLPTEEVFVSAISTKAPTPVDATATALNVLLVEDHEPTLKIMSKLLSKLGHRVTGVSSVASALAAAKQQRYDLLLSDLGLPDGSGLDLMKQVKAQYAGKSIALTGYGMEQDINDCRQAGFAAHLTKPIDMQRLQATIRQVIEND
ncbi:MAG TPA: PAS domain S-box protein [Tepidisphaeraceae bacterium]|nr:PAS domain S-box protein [Tepidisphaeraceae bacterium]